MNTHEMGQGHPVKNDALQHLYSTGWQVVPPPGLGHVHKPKDVEFWIPAMGQHI